MADERVQRRLAAIVSADVVGYSAMMGRDEAGTLTRLKALRADFLHPKVAEYGGRIVKTTGDGTLIEFPSAVDAVQHAVAVQRGMAERNAATPEEQQLRLRLGINVGDIVIDGDDIYGDGVNVAARLEALAEPGGFVVSDDVVRQIQGKLDLAMKDLGEQRLKNISRPVRIYRVEIDAPALSQLNASGAVKPVREKPSIAVLPFTNMSGDPEQEYFADGMTEDLITDLSQVSGLFVIARNSSFAFKGQSVDIREVGRKLGVKYVLEGSVRKAGDTLRINAQLVEADKGGHLWAKRYDRKIEDIFALQDEITGQIVSALQVNLTSDDENRADRRPSISVEAHDLFLKGRARYFRYTPEDHAAARVYFERAIALDPQFAEAYSFLSYCYSAAWNIMHPGFDDGLERALPLAEKAVSLDPKSPIAHMRLGWAQMFQRQYERAESSFETAKTLGPDIGEVYAYYGQFVNYTGEPQIALDLLQCAFRLEPVAPGAWNFMVGHSYWLLREHDEALRRFHDTIDRVPGFPFSYLYAASSHVELGQIDEAQKVIQALLATNSMWSVRQADRILPIRSDEIRRRLLEGLRKAGLSE